MKCLAIPLALLLALTTVTQQAQATFLVDTFNRPTEPPDGIASHSSPSTYFGPFDPLTPSLVSRTLAATPGSILVAGSGLLTGVLAGGGVATVTWAFTAPVNLDGDRYLELIGFNRFSAPGTTATITALVNGTPGSVTPVAWTAVAAPRLWIDHLGMGAVSSLSLVITAGGTGFSFTGDAVEANPEPATMTLLALGMSGVGYSVYRRRRKEGQDQPQPQTAA